MSFELSVFLNSASIMAVGALCAWQGMDSCFERRRQSQIVFWVYMACKASIRSFYDVLSMSNMVDGTGLLVWSLVNEAFGILSYLVLYYTWDAGFCKIGIGGLIVDGLGCLAAMASFAVADLAFGSDVGPVMDYRAALGPGTAIVCAVTFALYQLLLKLSRPLFKLLNESRIVHERFWAGVILVLIVAISIPRIDYSAYVTFSAYATVGTFVPLLLCAGVHLLRRSRSERRRKELLQRERALAAEYDRAMSDQLTYLEQSAGALDSIAADFEHAQQAVFPVDLQGYIAHLEEICSRLRYGVYSDCPALDAMLASSKDELEKRGLSVTYQTTPLGSLASETASIAQAMLAWAIESYGSARAASSERLGAARNAACAYGNPPADIVFRISRVGGQVVLVLETPSDKRVKFPQRLLKERSLSYQGALVQTDDGTRKTVRVLVCAGGGSHDLVERFRSHVRPAGCARHRSGTCG